MSRRRALTTGALVAALACVTTACGPTERVTLDDLGAGSLSGQNGPDVADRCDALPAVPGASSVACGRGSSTGESNSRLTAGDYVVVLLCEAPGTFRLEAARPAEAFDAVEVSCSDDDDPATSPRFTVPDSGVESMHESFDGEGQNVTMIVRVPDEG